MHVYIREKEGGAAVDEQKNVFALFDRYRELMDAEYDTEAAIVRFGDECRAIVEKVWEHDCDIKIEVTQTVETTHNDDRGKFAVTERHYSLFLFRGKHSCPKTETGAPQINQTPVGFAKAVNRILSHIHEGQTGKNFDTEFLRESKIRSW